MAFRRRFNPRFSRRGPRRRTGVTAAVASRLDRKAPKRYDWVPIRDAMCTVGKTSCKGCCIDVEFPENPIRGCTYDADGVVEADIPVPFPFVLIPPADPSSSGQDGLYQQLDNVTVVRMVGWLELCPYFCNSADFTAAVGADPGKVGQYTVFQKNFETYHLRAGISKDKWIFQPPPPASNDPGSYGVVPRYPLSPQEWSDAQFLKQWDRVKAKQRATVTSMLNGDAPQGCCPDVTGSGGGSSNSILTDGTGTIDGNDPISISTDCEPCNGNPNTFRSWGPNVSEFPCFRLSLNMRRRLVFKENEGLTLWVDWTSFDGASLLQQGVGSGWRPNVGFYWRMQLKALLER